jgi:hypothetical protein
MRTLKSLILFVILAAAANSIFNPAQAQSPSVGDIKAAAEAAQAVTDQQKTISDNQDKIDAKLADIAENLRVARLFAARAK